MSSIPHGSRMKRIAAALVTAATVTAASVTLAPALSANAQPTGQVAPAVPRVANGLVEGVVTVSEGRGQDDVVVVAFKGEKAVASAITYASRRANGPQHGYFFLNLGPGDYELRFWKRGVFDDTKHITVGRGARISLGEVDLNPVGDFDADPYVELVDELWRQGQKVPVKVEVPSPSDFWFPRGDLKLMEGKRVLESADLAEKDHGKTTFKVSGLSVGKHKLHVSFAGKDGLRSYKSKPFVVNVTPKRRLTVHS